MNGFSDMVEKRNDQQRMWRQSTAATATPKTTHSTMLFSSTPFFDTQTSAPVQSLTSRLRGTTFNVDQTPYASTLPTITNNSNNILACLYRLLNSEEASRFQCHPAASCFEAIQTILSSIGLQYSAAHLKSVVVYEVLDMHDKDTKKAIQKWLDQYHQAVAVDDFQTLQRLQFLSEFANHHRRGIVSRKDRQKLYENMLAEGSRGYGGDDFALAVLSKKLKLDILLLDAGGVPMPTVSVSEPFVGTPQHAAMLVVDNSCGGGGCGKYRSLSFDGQFVFPKNTLPPTLTKLFRLR